MKTSKSHPDQDNDNLSTQLKAAVSSDSSKLSTSYSQHISSFVKEVSLSNIIKNIQLLSGFPSRFTFSSDIVQARQWIYEQFVNIGYANVEYQDFILCDSLQKNIICSKKGIGDPDRVIILCAHYDSTGRSTIGWNWEKCPAPGANDNASGIAALIEIARILKNIDLNYTVRLIAFTGEEQNLMGSRAYAKYALSNKMEIVLVINLDEIGYPDARHVWDVEIEEEQVNDTRDKNGVLDNFSQVMVQSASVYTSLNTKFVELGASDHKPFHSLGYPVLGVRQAGKYPHSHKITDIHTHVDMEYIVEVTRMTLVTIMHVARIQE